MLGNIEALSKAVNEATVIKKMMLTIEDEINRLTSNIDSNKKEIERLQILIPQTEELEKKLATKQKDLKAHSDELSVRLNKLEQAGVKIPLNDPVSVRGFVNL